MTDIIMKSTSVSGIITSESTSEGSAFYCNKHIGIAFLNMVIEENYSPGIGSVYLYDSSSFIMNSVCFYHNIAKYAASYYIYGNLNDEFKFDMISECLSINDHGCGVSCNLESKVSNLNITYTETSYYSSYSSLHFYHASNKITLNDAYIGYNYQMCITTMDYSPAQISFDRFICYDTGSNILIGQRIDQSVIKFVSSIFHFKTGITVSESSINIEFQECSTNVAVDGYPMKISERAENLYIIMKKCPAAKLCKTKEHKYYGHIVYCLLFVNFIWYIFKILLSNVKN